MLVLCSPHRWFISLSLLLIKHRVVIITLWGKWLHLLVTLHIKNGASYWCKFECHDFRHIETRGNVLTRWLSLVFLSGVGVVAQLNPDNLTALGPLRIGRGFCQSASGWRHSSSVTDSLTHQINIFYLSLLLCLSRRAFFWSDHPRRRRRKGVASAFDSSDPLITLQPVKGKT